MTIKCQCPVKGQVEPHREDLYSEKEKSGMNHEPHKCPCTSNLKKYKRDEQELWLCSCCNLLGDILIEELSEEQK